MKKNILVLISCIVLLSVTYTFAQGKSDVEKKRMRPALLVIDIQNAFLPMVSESEKGIALYMINGMIDLFRKSGYPVIRIYHTDLQEGPKPGTNGFEFPTSIKILSSDPKIIKNYPNGFKKTELEKTIRELGCNTLFLCGLSSVGCVIATYFGAKDLDYNTFLIKDALMSHNSTYTDQIENIFNALDWEAIKVMLENAEKPKASK